MLGIRDTRLARLAEVVYRLVICARNRLYDSRLLPIEDCQLPVISIGNITVGGSGKTPFTAWVALGLASQGRRPVVVTRGYGARVVDPIVVTPDRSPESVGDESLLLAQLLSGKATVIACSEKWRAARRAKEFGDIVIVDDGLQHRRLRRHVDIVLVRAEDVEGSQLYRKERLLPAGRLREPAADALSRASLIVITSRSENAGAQVTCPLPIFTARFVAQGVRRFSDGVTFPSDWLQGKELLLLSAIADPDSFRRTVSVHGARIVGEKRFADHAGISPASISLFRRGTIPIIVTAKDAVKIAPGTADVFVLLERCEVANEELFWQALEERLHDEHKSAQVK